MVEYETDEYLVIAGTGYDGKPLYFDKGGYSYGHPNPEIGFDLDEPRVVAKYLNEVRKSCPEEFKPHIERVKEVVRVTNENHHSDD